MILEAADIRAGMRVLDLGCGAGNTAFVAADLVGPSGAVLGIDQSPEAIARANRRAQQRPLGNTRFIVGDIHDPAPDGPYDAIIESFVLMYLPDPATVIRTQASVLRPGGVIAPIEIDLSSARAVPPTPLVGQALSWVRDAFTRSGVEPTLGPRLWTVLRKAGLRPVGMLGVQPHLGPEDPDGAALLAGIVRTVVPLLERTHVAIAAEVEPDTLERRLSDELVAAGAVFAHPMLLSAWALHRPTPM